MALDSTPWIVGGGAEHSPEVVRQALYDSTGGAEGVSSVGGLKVLANGTPNGTVRVLPGGGILNNRYAGGAGQSYAVRNASQTSVSIKATGSGSGRVDMVVIRVLDPQYEGSAPPDPNDFQYTRLEVIEGVSAGVKTAKELNLGYPAIALAKITLPKSTGTVTAGMIEDLRKMAQPRRQEVLRARPAVAVDTETLSNTVARGEYFPNAGALQMIAIPEWATRAIIEATWIQVREPGGNAFGECWVDFGPFKETGVREYATQRFNWNTNDGPDVSRGNWEVADDRYIDPSIRGTEQPFIMMARVQGATNNAARPQIDGKSGVKMRVTFLEEADRSTS